MSDTAPSFGDNVRIRATPLTKQLGVANLTGAIYGETKPSITNVEVIGDTTSDFAINVMLDSKNQQLWFSPELIEFLDHGAGSEAQIGSRVFTRDQSGQWNEKPGTQPPLKPGFIARLFGSFRARK